GIRDRTVTGVQTCALPIYPDADGNISAGWTPWIQVPDWFSQDTQGAGITVADLNGNGRLDLVVLMGDNGAQLNRGVYRVGHDLRSEERRVGTESGERTREW